jgi:hypothetical protein
MKIAIVSRNPKLYSTRRFVEAATERGHEAQVVDVLFDCLPDGREVLAVSHAAIFRPQRRLAGTATSISHGGSSERAFV